MTREPRLLTRGDFARLPGTTQWLERVVPDPCSGSGPPTVAGPRRLRTELPVVPSRCHSILAHLRGPGKRWRAPLRRERRRCPDLARCNSKIGSWTRRSDPGEWLAQYFQTCLERDVRDLTQVGDLEAFGRWLSVLEASFVIFLLPPYHRSFSKRLTKRARLYLVDTGLLCWLLRIRNAEQLASHAARGAVFENLVIAEALKAGCNAGERPDLYHRRDQRGNEIDLLVETPDGPHAVEIESGETVGSDFFRGLARWRTLAEGSAPATLVCGGTVRRHGKLTPQRQ